MTEMWALTNISMGINLSALIAHMTFIHGNIMRHKAKISDMYWIKERDYMTRNYTI